MKLLALGHDVTMGARAEGTEKARAFVDAAVQAKLKGTAHAGTFFNAGAVGDLVINCTSGAGSVPAVKAADAKNLAGKILIDVANPLDLSKGFPPTLTVMNTDSLGEQLQRLVPDTHVGKALNTLSAELMVNPAAVGAGDHDQQDWRQEVGADRAFDPHRDCSRCRPGRKARRKPRQVGVPACAACHSPSGAGVPAQYPRLSGQFADYTYAQLQGFVRGDRGGEIKTADGKLVEDVRGKVMTTVASRMSDREMRAVAEYISGLR